MMGKFETWVTSLRVSWMGPRARGIMGGFAAALGDRTLATGLQAVLEHLPLNATDPQSIALILSGWQIEPGPSLSFSDQQQLAMAAPNLNRFRGTGLGLVVALYYADFPGAVVVTQNGLAWQITGTPSLDDLAALAEMPWPDGTALPTWLTITTLPNGNPAIPASSDGKPAIAPSTVPWWTFDAGMDSEGNQFCSRFGVLFPAGGPDPGLGTQANLDRIRRVIQAWRPGKASCFSIVVGSSGLIWGWPATQVWGGGGLVWGGTETVYSA